MKEFLMTDEDFSSISQRVYETCGIVLGPHKRDMVYSRLARRVRANGLASFAEYLALLSEEPNPEFSHFINAITTNLTSFFREAHHFDFLHQQVIPELKIKHKTDKRVRIWSAGCSTGEEAYSIAMTIANAFPGDWDVKVLATDLDSNVLHKGQEGVYNSASVTGLDSEHLKKWFMCSSDGTQYKAKDVLRSRVFFKRLNLLEPWPMKGPFDVIFCRNVLIYFDKETKDRLFDNYHQLLAEQGYLFIGHSETMGKEHLGFKNLGKTMYQKVAQI
ncbi:chemotaxis protein methyltransferase CheR [Pseudoalteromonas rubra]|uniref:Chemotaxis protein methyltransferase n=1 Tax=Pseudoalteromonas rubra TaxID=43658 RepID=A0A8T0C5P2_9GAMM|nr:protein-glutamate O-methyltransferase CheR [Pseudoalteromonas rubra]KAF7785342.1 chemotaxis protein methyltransferase CheR [Pseudoalteromonas rubra]